MKFLKQKAVFMIYLTLTLMFTVSLMPVAFAQDDALDTNSCCERTISGDTCVYTDAQNCDSSYQTAAFQKCEDVPFCKVGCCVSADDGSCSRQTSKATCEIQGYDWHNSPDCEINECQKGCCVLGGASCAYATEGKCDNLLLDYPELNKDFREAASEIACTNVCQETDKGCCVADGGDECNWGTRTNCGLEDGTGSDGFYKEVFCSNENIACECQAQEYKGCLEGSDDVYWFDSCGNPEGVAENCDYGSLSTICSEADDTHDESYCKTVNCEVTWDDPTSGDPRTGGVRLNGESWCSYDAKTGPTFDVVGARHYRHICVNGKELVEPCKDYREEICISGTVEDAPQGAVKSAACVPNRWKECTVKCNTAKDAKDQTETGIKMQADKKCCERSDLRDCFWQGDETNGVCMPLIASGFKHWSDSENGATPDSNAVAECEKGNYEIITKWGRKKLVKDDPWKCKENCNAYEDEILQSRNQYCRSLGDCGAHYNYLGGFSNDGLTRSWEKEPLGEPKIWITEELAGNYEEKWVKAGNALDFGKFSIGKAWGTIGQTKGFEGVIAGGAIGGTLAVAVASIAAVAAITAATSTLKFSAVFAAAFGPVGWIVSAAILLAAIFTIMFTWPETQDRPIKISCQPWQAPVGGEQCTECDNNPLKPCSEYRCRSLGATCRFIKENEGTTRETCFNSAPNDVQNPKITPNREAFKVISKREDITERFRIDEVQQGYKITPDIPAFANVNFGIKTDELSQCYIDREFKDPFKFSDLQTPFPNTFFDREHNISYNNLLPGTEYRFYIACRDNNGNPKVDEYIAPYTIDLKTDSSPDLEAPVFIATELPKEGKVPAYENETIIQVYIDEASDFDCRIEKEDRDYELMEGEMGCAQTPPESILASYNYCVAKFNVSEGTNTVYLRCKDNPTNSESNTNTESYVVNFEKTEPLEILAAGPSGNIYDRNITMFVDTAKGANNGEALCTFESEQAAGEFTTTNVAHNENIFSDLLADTYNFNIRCSDFVGNIAETTITFTSKRDNDAPTISSLRKSGNVILLELNEPATCEYQNQTFSFGYGTTSAINARTHSLSGEQVYEIICEDIFGNKLSGIKIYPELPRVIRKQKSTPSQTTEPEPAPSNVQLIGS